MHLTRYVGLTALICVLAATPARTAEPDRFLPDDTEIVMTVNVRQMLEAPLVKKHCLDLVKGYLQGKPAIQSVLDTLGFDPFRDVTTVTASSPSANESEKMFAIVRGRFELAKFQAKAEETAKAQANYLKIHVMGTHKIYEVNDPAQADFKPVFVALIDNSTLVASGIKDYVVEALARASGQHTGSLKKEVRDLIAKVDDKQSIWLVAPGTPLAKSELAGDDRAKRSLDKIASVTAGITIDEAIRADIAVTTKSPEDAQALAAEMSEGLEQAKGLLQVLAGNQAKLTPLVALLGAIKTSASGNVTSLRAEVTVGLFEKLLKQE